MQIDLKSVIVDNDTGKMMDYFGMSYITPSQIQDDLKQANGQDIQLNIASEGGDVFAASEMYTMLKMYSGKVTGVIQGMAASAATIVAEACDHLMISPAGQMMIHKASFDPGPGNADDMNHNSIVLDKVDQTIAGIYQAKTGKSMNDLINLMKNETQLTAKEAVDQGFADEVMFQNEQAPRVVNSRVSIPSKQAVNRFLKLINNVDTQKITDKRDASQYADDLFLRKLKIMQGDKDA